MQMKKQEGDTENKSMHIVPISGLCISRVVRLEQEMRTVSEVWHGYDEKSGLEESDASDYSLSSVVVVAEDEPCVPMKELVNKMQIQPHLVVRLAEGNEEVEPQEQQRKPQEQLNLRRLHKVGEEEEEEEEEEEGGGGGGKIHTSSSVVSPLLSPLMSPHVDETESDTTLEFQFVEGRTSRDSFKK